MYNEIFLKFFIGLWFIQFPKDFFSMLEYYILRENNRIFVYEKKDSFYIFLYFLNICNDTNMKNRNQKVSKKAKI